MIRLAIVLIIAAYVLLLATSSAVLIGSGTTGKDLTCRYFTGFGTVEKIYDPVWRQVCPRIIQL
ncbi:hypothetical protein JNB88_26490 [Rhizobium cauense]|uniref:hypothetical protein n=1 Tax=Rhizobium cauense TaxID=1166683 RepID=UPI001C6E043E|nr:hypothetical protein [Rhizobium cauense]MBW9117177.1 hypothetical protein [Rhizobium cauense]